MYYSLSGLCAQYKYPPPITEWDIKQFSLFPPCNKSYVLHSDVFVEKFCSKINRLRADLYQKIKAVSCQADTERGAKVIALAYSSFGATPRKLYH